MSQTLVPAFPWITVPRIAQPGQVHAFADREQQLSYLYKAMVAAGNAVTHSNGGASDGRVRARYVVSGYKGVGKSALILQALGMLRDELGIVDGQQVEVPPGLPEPLDRQRWLVLYASGKSTPGVDAIADVLRRSILSALDDVRRDVEKRVERAIHLSLFHRLFHRREKELFNDVRAALLAYTYTIDYVRHWHGATQSEKVARAEQFESSKSVEAQLESQLKTQVDKNSTAAQAALKLASRYIYKHVGSTREESGIEQNRLIGPDLALDALNGLFDTTDRAGVPTILVLDDFDEFASHVGSSHHERAKVLQSVVGVFSQLRPSCLVIALRAEYMHEDVERQYESIPVLPMTRRCAADALGAWSRVQQPPLGDATLASLKELGDRLLGYFDKDEPVVVPFTFLQMVAWLANNAGGTQRTDEELLLQYMKGNYHFEEARIARRLAEALPPDWVYRVAAASPVDLGELSLTLTNRERLVLEKAGLLRPAVAGDPTDPTVIVDPLIAYLRAAKLT
jgi:hypothetical protein